MFLSQEVEDGGDRVPRLDELEAGVEGTVVIDIDLTDSTLRLETEAVSPGSWYRLVPRAIDVLEKPPDSVTSPAQNPQ